MSLYPDVTLERVQDNGLSDIVNEWFDAGVRMGYQLAKGMISARISPDVRFAVIGAFTADSVGNIFVEGHKDQMLVQEFTRTVTVPTDPQSGQRVHKPFIITVVVNKAAPLLYNALASGEMLPNVELKWYHTSTEFTCTGLTCQ